MPSIHGPTALLPAPLKELSVKLLSRLRLIPELRRWFSEPASGPNAPNSNPGDCVQALWNCFVQGAPLLILLDMLGPRAGDPILPRGDSLSPNQDTAIIEFLRRLRILEIQGVVSYGESFKTEELVDGSCHGFMKVLNSVCRVLSCLESTYPNLYELLDSTSTQLIYAFDNFTTDELEYLSIVRKMIEYTSSLNTICTRPPYLLECLITYLERIRIFQEHIVTYSLNVKSTEVNTIDWEELFAFKRDDLRVIGTGSYQSYCTDYPSIVLFFDELKRRDKLTQDESSRQLCIEMSKLLARPLKHVLDYSSILETILVLIHPIDERQAFDSLCLMKLRFMSLSSTLLEVSQFVRTSQAIRIINERAFFWGGPDPAVLGDLLLDDCISVGITGLNGEDLSQSEELSIRLDSFYHVFLFDQAILLCRPPDCREEDASVMIRPLIPLSDISCRYPIEPYDLGPALRAEGSLSVSCSIPTSDVLRIYRPEHGELSFDIIWTSATDGTTNSITLNCSEKPQLEQWIHVLRIAIPSDALSFSLEGDSSPTIVFSDAGDLSWMEELERSDSVRTRSKAKPWSLIARMEEISSPGYHSRNGSETSLFSRVGSLSQHNMRVQESTSPRSLASFHSQMMMKRERAMSPLKLSSEPECITDPSDLTGQVIKIEDYPAAHGGFADVWKCDLVTGSERQKVAVKVLRGRLVDRQREEKLTKRLQRELKVWQRLEHENVIPLYGTCNNFGRYVSLVCPWYENGSVKQYLVKYEEDLRLQDRLKLLSEIASGLAYLHSFSIIHGDLSSSNVLVNDNKQACLCDFGLSTVVGEYMDNSYPSSTIGGAVRWAAPELYNIPEVDQPYTPQISVSSDVYSYGSIALEILSGKVPYHYLKHDGQVLLELSKRVKPTRPASAFLTNELWRFIGECWEDSPAARPSSLDVTSRISTLYQRTISRHSY